MPKWVEKILKYNPGEKSLNDPFAIYLDFECLIKKEQPNQNNNNNNDDDDDNNNNNNNLENLTQRKKLSMSLLVGQCLFDGKENKFDSCRREDCVEKLCKNVKNGAMKIINYEKKKKKWHH